MTAAGTNYTTDGDDEASALRQALDDAQREIDQLEHAIQTRDVIATAKGMLMAKEQISSHAAFEVLRRASQRENIRIREIAERMVLTHDARITT